MAVSYELADILGKDQDKWFVMLNSNIHPRAMWKNTAIDGLYGEVVTRADGEKYYMVFEKSKVAGQMLDEEPFVINGVQRYINYPQLFLITHIQERELWHPDLNDGSEGNVTE
jgi:hypothetical protein